VKIANVRNFSKCAPFEQMCSLYYIGRFLLDVPDLGVVLPVRIFHPPCDKMDACNND
jgi:hypothetical protein